MHPNSICCKKTGQPIALQLGGGECVCPTIELCRNYVETVMQYRLKFQFPKYTVSFEGVTKSDLWELAAQFFLRRDCIRFDFEEIKHG